MQTIYIKHYLHFRNLKEIILKIMRKLDKAMENTHKVSLNYSINFDLEKKTIVFDIDETLVFASETRLDIPQDSIDTAIYIKVNRYGKYQKAYLSFRPNLFEMLNVLHEEFELILYTCGTKQYASAFNEAVHKAYNKKFHKG